MPLEKRPNAEPIRGYRLLDKLGAGGFGEVWKCEAPGGIHKAIKFVFGNLQGVDGSSKKAEDELRAVQLIKSIRHPFLLSIDRVECVQGELLIVTELADHNLFERWQDQHKRGLPGIPREELLRYLREAAEVLDLLNQKFDLQHLDIKPHNLFLVSDHVKVADFGLINRLAGSQGLTDVEASASAVTPLYAAPELFQGKLSRHCDQYSLAIVYQELLTGTRPFEGRNSRQLLLQHLQADPDLSALPAADRAVVARALAKCPEQRFASCLDLVRALQHEPANTETVIRADTDPDFVTAPPTPDPSTGPLKREVAPTRRNVPAPLPALPAALDGYTLKHRTGNSSLLEVWQAQAPDGRKKLVQFAYGLRSAEPKLKEAVARLRSVHHPALFAPEIAHVEKGRLVVVTDSFRETVRDRFRQCQARKQPGIPRGELVDYLRAAAEVIDYLYHQHGVQHLSLNPRSLVLDNGWLQIAEFGYAQLLWVPEGQDIARRNARYAAPEFFGGAYPPAGDQFSLALIYAEMLTGVHPFRGESAERSVRRGAAPYLARLPELDREVIERALHADPQRRWPSCTEMMLALEGTSPELSQELLERPDSFAQLLQNDRGSYKEPICTGTSAAEINTLLSEIVRSAGGAAGAPAVLSEPTADDPGTIRHTFQAGLPIGTAHAKLEAYRRELGAELRRQEDSGCLLHLQLPASFWQQWLGRQPGLELDVRLSRVNAMSATPIAVSASVRAVNCKAIQARDLLARTGADLIDTLQRHLLVNSEKRVQDRLLWPHEITVIPLQADGQRDEPIVCRGKDISHTGIGFYLPHELLTADVLIELSHAANRAPTTIPATLVRAKRCADGWYEVGALFRVPALRRSQAEVCV